jgi:DNA (cytosine-5)-methyltransferase 1
MLRVTSLFSGIGAFEQALTNLGIEYELVNFCEIDKYAIKAYCAIHNVDESLNLGDIDKVDLNNIEYCDLLTHGSPCTDYSISGKQQGGDEGSETRSSLMWDTVEIVNKIKPKYVIWENVKNVLSVKHKHNFEKYINKLEELGYNNYYKVLNAKDYSIPQNRERIFVVSIRKDFDKDGYIFPEKQELKLRLKDILEDNVDEKYYINNDRTEKLLKTLKFKNIKNSNNIIQMTEPKFSQQRVYSDNGISPTIAAGNNGGGKEPCKILQVGLLDIKGNEQVRRVYSEDGLSPTLNTMCGGNRQPKILKVGNIYNSQGQNGNIYDENGISPTISAGTTDNVKNSGIGSNNAPKILKIANETGNHYGGGVFDKEGISPTLISSNGGGGTNNLPKICEQRSDEGLRFFKDNICETIRTIDAGRDKRGIENNYRIRKLTPLECWRLMGFKDEQFNKAKNIGISNTQLYKQAGNSIVVNVLEAIFINLFKIQ